jgi:hypothetical protein
MFSTSRCRNPARGNDPLRPRIHREGVSMDNDTATGREWAAPDRAADADAPAALR